MIIRRRHTKNFTTVPNEVFDGRLLLDEVGLLSYLLSRPPDWEVRRSVLGRQWGVGTDRLKRIFNNLMKTGWCRAEKVRLIESGQFRITYDICDEPGPGLSDEEVRRALSLVSSEVADGSSEEDQTGLKPEEPPPTQPGVDDQGVVTGGWEESLNKDSQNIDSTKAVVPIWRDVRAKWPAGDILSPPVCEKLWAALPQVDKQQAYRAIEPYIANCKAKNRKLCDLSTYLKERRFVGKLALPTTAVAIRGGTPQAQRWLDYRHARGEPTGFMRDIWREGKAWYAPTEWPPALPTKNESTGPPPLGLCTTEDEAELKI